MDDLCSDSIYDDPIHQGTVLPARRFRTAYVLHKEQELRVYVNDDKGRLAPIRVFLPIPTLPNSMPFLRLSCAYQIPSVLLLVLLFQNPENGSSLLSRILGAPLLPPPSSTPQ